MLSFNSKDGAIDRVPCIKIRENKVSFNSKDGAIDSQRDRLYCAVLTGFNSKDGAIDSNIDDYKKKKDLVSIPKMVRLIDALAGISTSVKGVSIPKMVRLIETAKSIA